jgi:exodeoxyribonuclease V gamma subunit
MLHLHTSTDYNLLAQAYQRVDKNIPKPLLAPHPLVVPNMAIGRWVSQQGAKSNGISANLELILPAKFIWRLTRQLNLALPLSSDFDEDVIVFSILDAFNDQKFCAVYPRLNSYLYESDQLNRYHLAKRVAQVFLNYQLYRSDWLLAWTESRLLGLGEDEPWQQALWLRLTQMSEQATYSELNSELITALKHAPSQFALPSALCVFGVNQAPPAFYELLKTISHHIDVHVFTWLLNDYKQPSALHHWMQASEQFKNSFSNTERELIELPAEAGQASQLVSLQGLLLGQQQPLNQPDNSLAVVSCYSPMREVEALHDYLLNLFQADRSLEPGDVLVAVSDVDAYTPIIRAVFDRTESPIPYSVNESFAGKESALLKGLLALLDISQWRFTREELEILLHNRLIRHHFAISASDLEQLHAWFDGAAIRWGIDGDHREELGLPNNNEHTWRAGLDRLLLGFALPCSLGGRLPLYGDQQVLPVDEVESGSSELLSRFICYAEQLFTWRERFKKSYSVSEWQQLLRNLLVEFFDVDALEEGIKQQLLQVIERLGDNAKQAASQSQLDVKTIRCILEDNYNHIGRSGRLSGAVSFTGLSTLAGLPYKVVCMLGMDYDKWPKRSNELGFNLMAKDEKRMSDRCDSDLQRFQTLQLLLSAKQSVYISYTGQDIKSGEHRPESVLVAELLNVADQAGIPISRYRHGMHPFSLSNFQHGLLQSHSSQWLQTAEKIGRGDKTFSALSQQVIGTQIPSAINLDDLIRFFANPQKAFLKNALSIYMRDQAEEWDNSEPFALANFTDRSVRECILSNKLAKIGGNEQDSEITDGEGFALNKSSGLLPHGEYGKLLHDRELSAVEAILDYAPLGFVGNELEFPYQQITLNLEADRELSNIPKLLNTIQQIEMGGKIKHASSRGIQHLLVDDLYDYKKIAFWLEHLFMCCCQPERVKPITHVIYCGKNQAVKEWFLKAPTNSENILATWVEAYLQGLSYPLPFFAKTSGAYAGSFEKHQELDKALGAAKKVWRDGFNHPGQGSKPHNDFLFRDEEPLDEIFAAWAELLLLPMMQHSSNKRPDEIDETIATNKGSIADA